MCKNPWEEIEYLVFSGGGLRGISYVGVINALEVKLKDMREHLLGQ